MKTLKILILFFTLNIFAQQEVKEFYYKTASLNPKANFYDIVNTQRQYFTSLRSKNIWTKKEQKAYKQFERWVYIWQDRINADGSFPNTNQVIPKSSLTDLLLQKNYSRSPNSISANQWIAIGPTENVNPNNYSAYPGMGRINVVTVDSSNEQIMYAGAAAGGVWKTVDGGNSWNPIGDNFAGMGITDILIDPNNSNTIYVATGDEDGQHIESIGVYKSTDGGNSWFATGLTFNLGDGQYIRDLAFYPGNSQKIFALINTEIMVSTDGGTSWSAANVDYSPYQPFSAYFQTIIFNPNNANNIIVSDIWGGLFISTDGGSSFALHQALSGDNYAKILKLASSPNDLSYFYGLDYLGNFMKYRYNMDNTDNDLISTTQISGFNSQGGYNIAIAISPTNKNNIIVGGVRGYVSTDNGQSFSVKLNPYNDPPGVGFYVHPDHHHMSFLSNGTTVINGHDGGVHKGEFSADSWTDISNSLVITQSYNIAITQAQNGDDFLMANQDNDGFSKVLKDGIRQWVAAASGDGTAAGIDYSNPDIRYLGGTNGALYRSSDGYASSAFSGTTLLSATSNAAFVSPMEIHPTVPTTIYAAYGNIQKSTNSGDNWTNLNSPATMVEYIHVSTYNSSTHLCIIDSDGSGYHSTDNGSNWSAVTAPSGLTLTSLISQPNSDVLYASVSGYDANNKVFKSTDGGSTWQNISSGLPNIVMKRLILKTDENNETLFVGTELGVYWKNNTMTNWEKLGTDLPNVIVNDLRINYADQELYIGTFGRGMWKIDVSNLANVEFTELEKPKIYPNPVINENIFIQIPNDLLQTNLNYKLYNIVGGIISEGKINSTNFKINVSNTSSGLYMLKIYNNEKSMVQKLIINSKNN